MFLLKDKIKKPFFLKPQKVVLGKGRRQKAEGNTSREAGVTLLLAILILSSVMAISFSLATIMFIEVRSSGDLLKTEPAIYAATGIGEQAFFNLERHACTSNGAECYNAGFSNNVIMPNTPAVLSTSEPIFTDKVKTGSTFDSTLNKYDFCNIASGTSGCNYGKVVVSYTPTNNNHDPLYAYLCQFDPTTEPGDPCSKENLYNPGQGWVNQDYWKAPDNSYLSPIGYVYIDDRTNPSVSWTLDPGLQQKLILTNPSGSGDIYVKISTYADQAGSSPQGLPYVGQTAVNIGTQNASVGRKIQVVVPNSSSSSGSGGSTDTVWVEDALPAGASSQCDSWSWLGSNPSPFGGSLALHSDTSGGTHQYCFAGASPSLAINTGDTLFAYVYLDSANPPSEVMLQWYSDTQGWNHRAYWGANNIGWGADGTTSRHQVSSSVPASGQWVRLEVPASAVGLEGLSINGIAFTLFGGQATFDHAGKKP